MEVFEEQCGFLVKIYRINTSDGFYYYGSTRTSLPQRLSLHRQSCADGSPYPLYQHIRGLANGWKDTTTEVVKQVFVFSVEQQRQAEEEVMRPFIGEANCLNRNHAYMTIEERKEACRKYAKSYYQSNKEKVLANIKEYRKSDAYKAYREINRERAKQYYYANKDKVLEKARERRKRGQTNQHPECSSNINVVISVSPDTTATGMPQTQGHK